MADKFSEETTIFLAFIILKHLKLMDDKYNNKNGLSVSQNIIGILCSYLL